MDMAWESGMCRIITRNMLDDHWRYWDGRRIGVEQEASEVTVVWNLYGCEYEGGYGWPFYEGGRDSTEQSLGCGPGGVHVLSR